LIGYQQQQQQPQKQQQQQQQQLPLALAISSVDGQFDIIHCTGQKGPFDGTNSQSIFIQTFANLILRWRFFLYAK